MPISISRRLPTETPGISRWSTSRAAEPIDVKEYGMSVSEAPASAISAPPDRVQRHLLADRIYHWVMAASVLVLMGTAFLPIAGWKFEWVSLHWMTGAVLTLL